MTDTPYRLPEISVHTLAEWMQSKPDLILLDVREADELAYAPLRDPRVVHVPMSQISRLLLDAFPPSITPQSEMVVFCHVGGRSSQVVHWLNARNDFSNVYNLNGGIDAYAAEIDPTIARYA